VGFAKLHPRPYGHPAGYPALSRYASCPSASRPPPVWPALSFSQPHPWGFIYIKIRQRVDGEHGRAYNRAKINLSQRNNSRCVPEDREEGIEAITEEYGKII